MADTQLVTIAFRVHPALKRRIYQEAAGVRLKPSDYLRRRVETAFEFDPDVCDTDVFASNADIASALSD